MENQKTIYALRRAVFDLIQANGHSEVTSRILPRLDTFELNVLMRVFESLTDVDSLLAKKSAHVSRRKKPARTKK